MNSIPTQGDANSINGGSTAAAAPTTTHTSPVNKRWESKLAAVIQFLERYRRWASTSDDGSGSNTGADSENAISLIDDDHGDDDDPPEVHVSWLKQQEQTETWNSLSCEQQTKLRRLELHHPTWFQEQLWAPFFFGLEKANHKRPLDLPKTTVVAANSNKKRRVNQPLPPPKFKFKNRTKSSQPVAQPKVTTLTKSPVSPDQPKAKTAANKSPEQPKLKRALPPPPKKAPALSSLSTKQKEEEYLRLTAKVRVFSRDDRIKYASRKNSGVTSKIWMERYECLKIYQKLFGDTNVIVRWKIDPKLGKWVSRQRDKHNARFLTPDRIRLLKEVGFAWYLPPGSRHTSYVPTESITANRGVKLRSPPNSLSKSHQSTKHSSPSPKKPTALAKTCSEPKPRTSPPSPSPILMNSVSVDAKESPFRSGPDCAETLANAKATVSDTVPVVPVMKTNENKHEKLSNMREVIEVGRPEYHEDDISEYGVQESEEDDDHGQFEDCEEEHFDSLLPGQVLVPAVSREKPEKATGGYVQIDSPVRPVVTPPRPKNGGHQARVIPLQEEERCRKILADYHRERSMAEQKRCCKLAGPLPASDGQAFRQHTNNLSYDRDTSIQLHDTFQEAQDTGAMFPTLAEVKALFQALEARIVLPRNN